MTDPFEARLREDFRGLKAEDAAGAPDFRTLMETARESDESVQVVPLDPWGSPRRWAVAAAALAAAVAGILLLQPPDPARSFEAVVASDAGEAGGAGWRAPTDGLLESPGMELLTDVPSIGDGVGSFADPTETTRDAGNDA